MSKSMNQIKARTKQSKQTVVEVMKLANAHLNCTWNCNMNRGHECSRFIEFVERVGEKR